MVELVDTCALGAHGHCPVGVRVPLPAHSKKLPYFDREFFNNWEAIILAIPRDFSESDTNPGICNWISRFFPQLIRRV